jgi:hypothetical protein
MLLVLFGLLGMTSGFGQDVVLKKLYDGIEDMRLEVEQHNARSKSQDEYKEPFPTESLRLNNKIGLQLGKDCAELQRENLKKLSEADLRKYASTGVDKVFRGSFTRPNTVQELNIFTTQCGMGGDYGFAILEKGKFILIYLGDGITVDGEHYFSSYPRESFMVKDVNQNGVNEIMLLVQSRAKSPWDEMHAVHLLEFRDSKPFNLGSFFVGGEPMPSGEGAERISCSSDAPKELRTHFPSNIIYVQKGKVPQFFAESWEVNCDYLTKGVKARKVSGLTPIKPVPRAISLTRLF